MKETAFLLIKYTLKIYQLVKMRKPLLQNTDHFFLFEAGVLENLVFHKSTLQAL